MDMDEIIAEAKHLRESYEAAGLGGAMPPVVVAWRGGDRVMSVVTPADGSRSILAAAGVIRMATGSDTMALITDCTVTAISQKIEPGVESKPPTRAEIDAAPKVDAVSVYVAGAAGITDCVLLTYDTVSAETTGGKAEIQWSSRRNFPDSGLALSGRIVEKMAEIMAAAPLEDQPGFVAAADGLSQEERERIALRAAVSSLRMHGCIVNLHLPDAEEIPDDVPGQVIGHVIPPAVAQAVDWVVTQAVAGSTAEAALRAALGAILAPHDAEIRARAALAGVDGIGAAAVAASLAAATVKFREAGAPGAADFLQAGTPEAAAPAADPVPESVRRRLYRAEQN